MIYLGKLMLWMGVLLVVLGLIFTYGQHIPFFGKLPGDVHIQKKNFSFYFPIATCILLSIVLTLLFSLLRKR